MENPKQRLLDLLKVNHDGGYLTDEEHDSLVSSVNSIPEPCPTPWDHEWNVRGTDDIGRNDGEFIVWLKCLNCSKIVTGSVRPKG